MDSIVQSLEPITLIGGGEASRAQLSRCLSLAPLLVAADGGANKASALGHIPSEIIGDLDSVTEETLSALPDAKVHQISEQDSTDFDKSLRNIKAPTILAVGFTGARMDHQMAVMHTLIARADRPCIVVGETEIVFVCPPHLKLALEVGSVFSLFPMGIVRGTSQGLRWPIDGLEFGPDRLIGTSNQISGPLALTVDAPKMLCFAPVAALEQVVRALSQPDARWPALGK